MYELHTIDGITICPIFVAIQKRLIWRFDTCKKKSDTFCITTQRHPITKPETRLQFSVVTWASRCLRSQATNLFVQRKTSKACITVLCEGIHWSQQREMWKAFPWHEMFKKIYHIYLPMATGLYSQNLFILTYLHTILYDILLTRDLWFLPHSLFIIHLSN